MDEPRLVHCLQRLAGPGEHIDDHLLARLGGEPRIEGAPLDVLHGQVDLARVRSDVVDRDEVGMVHHRHGLRLAEHPLLALAGAVLPVPAATGMHLSLQDPDIQARVDRHFDELTKAVKTNLRRVKRIGQLREGLSVDMAADFVIGSTIAINTMNRNARDVRAGRHYVKAALDYMATWSAES